MEFETRATIMHRLCHGVQQRSVRPVGDENFGLSMSQDRLEYAKTSFGAHGHRHPWDPTSRARFSVRVIVTCSSRSTGPNSAA